MKNILINGDEAQELVNQIAEFDTISMNAIICMLIDTSAAKSGDDAVEIADTVYMAVKSINQEFGAYRL